MHKEEEQQWIEVYSNFQSFNAEIIAAKLSSEGIPTRITDQNIVASNPMLANAVGGVKVKVQSRFVAKAREIVLESEQEFHVHEDPDEELQERCPHCSSTLINRLPPPSWFWLLVTIVTLGAPLWLRKNKWYCFTCKTHFIKDFSIKVQ